MERSAKSKKRAITYGKAPRKPGYGRPIDLDSDDEVSSVSRQINGKVSKPAMQRDIKATSTSTSTLVSKLSTPPMSPSPSITSPSSSTGTKRTSPFLDEPSDENKKKVRRMNRASTSSLEEMFPLVEGKTRKPVPKLGRQKPLEPVWSTSDDTQLLLDNQLMESIPPPASPRPPPLATEKSVGLKKPSALKMPNRARPTKAIHPSVPDEVEVITQVFKPSSRNVSKGKEARNHNTNSKTLAEAAVIIKRPKTPDKTISKPSLTSVVSPSAIELEALQISINRNSRAKTPEPIVTRALAQPSPKPSPFRVKLKDRMTSDLNNMMMDVDSSINDISGYSVLQSQDQISPVIPKETETADSQETGPSSSQPNTQSSQFQGSKVTYGSARWTFLPDEDEEMTLLDPILDSQDSNNHTTRSRQLPGLTRSISDVAAFDIASDDEDDEPSTTMRSLHELKRAGGNQRINRQIEGLLDDVEHSDTKSQRINAMTELVLKLKQNSFLRHFLDSGAESRLLGHMELMKDTVARSLYCAAFLLILNHSNVSMMSIGHESMKLSQLCSKLLDQKNEVGAVVRTRNSNVSKDNQKNVEKLLISLQGLSVWSPSKPTTLTPRMIGLACLEHLIRKLREGGNRDEVLTPMIVMSLADNLAEWSPANDINTQLTVWLSLSTLESASLAFSLSRNTTAAVVWEPASILKLVTCFTSLLNSVSLVDQGQLVSLVLRLCLNLSNGDPTICAIFCNINFIRATLRISTDLFGQISSDGVSDMDLMLDNLVLSLGLLINLSEKTAEARDLFMAGEPIEQSPLLALLQLFKSRLEEAFEVTSEAKIRSNVPFGYLAVLLGYLCKSPAIFHQVRIRLDGGNLRLLLIAIGEFLQYHQKVEELRSAEAESEVKINFISRLQGLIDELKAKDSSVPSER